MTPAAVLKKARELISDEKAWTKGWFAKDERGRDVYADDPGAVCFCAMGAIDRAAEECGGVDDVPALNMLVRALGGTAIDLFNDAPERTHAEVLAAFDKAIASSEAGGGE